MIAHAWDYRGNVSKQVGGWFATLDSRPADTDGTSNSGKPDHESQVKVIKDSLHLHRSVPYRLHKRTAFLGRFSRSFPQIYGALPGRRGMVDIVPIRLGFRPPSSPSP